MGVDRRQVAGGRADREDCGVSSVPALAWSVPALKLKLAGPPLISVRLQQSTVEVIRPGVLRAILSRIANRKGIWRIGSARLCEGSCAGAHPRTGSGQ